MSTSISILSIASHGIGLNVDTSLSGEIAQRVYAAATVESGDKIAAQLNAKVAECIEALPEKQELDRLSEKLAVAKADGAKLSASEAALSGPITATISRGDTPTQREWKAVEEVRVKLSRANEISAGLESAVELARGVFEAAASATATEIHKAEYAAADDDWHRAVSEIEDAIAKHLAAVVVADGRRRIVNGIGIGRWKKAEPVAPAANPKMALREFRKKPWLNYAGANVSDLVSPNGMEASY